MILTFDEISGYVVHVLTHIVGDSDDYRTSQRLSPDRPRAGRRGEGGVHSAS